jgi:hypothetical protein
MRRLAVIVVVVGVLNFAAFIVGTFIVGGDAVNGRSSCPPGGKYLWDKRQSNPCHEVSNAVYLYSTMHTWSLFGSWPFVMMALVYLNRSKPR